MQINGISNFKSKFSNVAPALNRKNVNFTSLVFMNKPFLDYARQKPEDIKAWDEVIHAMRYNGDKYVVNISKATGILSDEAEGTGVEAKDIFQVSIHDPELNKTENFVQNSNQGVFDPLSLKTIYEKADDYFYKLKTHFEWVGTEN